MTTKESTLGKRGADLAAGDSIRDRLGFILTNAYDTVSNPGGVINIGTAENYVMLPEVSKFTKDHPIDMTPKHFSYGEGPWGTLRLRTAMAKHMTKYFKPVDPIDPSNLLFATGCTSLCEMLSFTLMDPGDGVLLTRPCYVAFAGDFSLRAKGKPVFVPFHDIDQFSPECIAKYETAYGNAAKDGITVKTMVLCHPHNPLGRAYPKESLIEIMKFCNKRKIHLIVDEIYALSVYDVSGAPDLTPFTSALSFDTTPYINTDYLHHLYGFSKDLASGGLRLGCLYTRNKDLMRAASAVTQFAWPGAADMQFATNMLEAELWMESFLSTSRERLAKANAVVRSVLDKHGIKYNKQANAGFFMWVDLRSYLPRFLEISSDAGGVDVLAKEMANLKFGELDQEKKDKLWQAEKSLAGKFVENKVFIMDGGAQAAEEPGFFRVIFSHPEEIIRKGLSRVIQVLETPN